jgi:hypothetical protein
MKRLLAGMAVLVIGLTMATPALAGHHGYGRGHSPRVVRGANFGYTAAYYGPVYHRPRPRASLFFGFGVPLFGFSSVYAPAPLYLAPAPVVVAPAPFWIPGHYVWDGGVRVFIEGHWSR